MVNIVSDSAAGHATQPLYIKSIQFEWIITDTDVMLMKRLKIIDFDRYYYVFASAYLETTIWCEWKKGKNKQSPIAVSRQMSGTVNIDTFD